MFLLNQQITINFRHIIQFILKKKNDIYVKLDNYTSFFTIVIEKNYMNILHFIS